MKYLFKKMWRDIRLSAGQYSAITAVVLLGVAFYVGLMSASAGVRVNIDEFYDTQKLAHLWVNGAFGENAAAEIRALPGVEAAEGRAAFVVTNGNSEFITHTLTDGVNLPFIENGLLPENGGECIVDRLYFDENGLQLGDRIGDYTITGVFNSPEYLYIAKSITESPNHEVYGALYVGGEVSAYNEIVVRVNKNADIDALKENIKRVAPNGVILGREQSFSWTMLDTDIEQFDKIGRVFPVIFFLVAAAIIFISMSKNVETQRGQIGNMKALGVRSRSVTLHFLSYTAVTCAIGCAIGALVGLFALVPFIQSIFTAFYSMPQMRAAGFGGSIAVASVLAFAFGIAATFISVRKPLAESPAAAMRPKPPKKMRAIWLERFDRLWAKLSYGRKIVLRNLFLNKGRALLSSVGIIGCVGLMVAAFSFLDCMNYILGDAFFALNKYDAIVVGKLPDGLRGVSKTWAQGSSPALFESGGEAVSTDLIALDADCDAITLYDKNGALLRFPKDGALLPKTYADKYGLGLGDTLTLSVNGQTIAVKIAGVAVEYLGQDIYASFEYLESLGVTLPITTHYLMTDGDAETIADEIAQSPGVKLAVTKEAMSRTWEMSLDIVYKLVYIMLGAAAVLSLTVVYNISSINIFERRRDIATLKVLGYHRKEVNRLVFRENLYITGFGAAFGIAAGAGFLWLIITMVVTDDMYVPMIMKWPSVALSIVLGFAFTALANQLLRGKIRKIDMVESLKSVE